jgi:spermidine/putrescine transport system substrate-binding protein
MTVDQGDRGVDPRRREWEEQAIKMSSNESIVTGASLTRRRFLAAGAVAGFGAFLAACGTSGGGSTAAPSAAASAAASAGASAAPSGKVAWANWTYYMDYDEATKAWPTLVEFAKQTGISVDYQEVVDDNNSFFGTIKPALEAGQPTGWDIITLTDWMAQRLIRLGWTEELDLAAMPDFTANIKDEYKGLNWDPEMKHHAPLKSGMTGLGFDKDVTGDLTSLVSLFTADPRWKGKVDYLAEMRDAVGLAMLKLGLDPSKPTTADDDAAIAEIQKAVDAGIVRDFKGNAYAEDLKSGDAVLSMAWSGDMVQALIDKPSLSFAIATEGGMLWTDNSMIPKGAANKSGAEAVIDYYYKPEVAALVTAYVNYLTPVKGVDAKLLEADPEIAKNPLIFPPPDVVARLHTFGPLSEADELYFNETFAKVTGVG